MKKLYSTLMLLAALMLQGAFAQEQAGLREKAGQLYSKYEYSNAAKIYLKLADVKKPKLADLERLADCFEKMNDYEAAENWLARVIQDPAGKTDNLLKYGRVLKSNARYAEAKKALLRYAEKAGQTDILLNEIAGCDSAVVWMAKPVNVKIVNEKQINTPLSEFGVFVGGGAVFYTSESGSPYVTQKDGRTGNPFLSIYHARKADDLTLSVPCFYQADFNEARMHNGPVIANKKGNIFYVTRTYAGNKGEVSKENKLKFKTQNLELYIYKEENGKWTSEPFAYNDIQKYSVGHAALSADEQTLYFVSDMPGGHGGTDIWYSERNTDGSWSKPQNAGPAINSAQNEMFPNMGGDGKLYFSSDGFPGMGGLDIFVSSGYKNNWTKPVNLKYPVNSAADDFAFVVNTFSEENNSGYFSSNRKGGVGGDDIYSFNYVKPVIILAVKGVTYNKKTGEILPAASLNLYNGNRTLIGKQNSREDGTFFFELAQNTDYKLLAQKEKFFSDSVSLTTVGINKSDTLQVKLYLDPLFEVGKVIALKNIHYNFDKDDIRADAAKILEELVRIMRDNPTLEIELGSHTDSRGSDIYNLDLSQRRARSVVNYLVGRGIERSRMVARGYGETQLLNRCSDGVKCSEAAHQENRRTEFKILKY